MHDAMFEMPFNRESDSEYDEEEAVEPEKLNSLQKIEKMLRSTPQEKPLKRDMKYLMRKEEHKEEKSKTMKDLDKSESLIPKSITAPSEPSFTWYKSEIHDEESYLCYVNESRETMQAGDQAFYFYGKLSNKPLFTEYGFCFPGNRYDSYEVGFKMRADITFDTPENEIIDIDNEWKQSQMIRFKTDQINRELVGYLRYLAREECLSKAVSLEKELELMYKYLSLVKYLQHHWELETTLEEDLDRLAEDEQLDGDLMMAIVYRSEKKKIIRSQIHLVTLVIDVLQRAADSVDSAKNSFSLLAVERSPKETEERSELARHKEETVLAKWDF